MRGLSAAQLVALGGLLAVALAVAIYIAGGRAALQGNEAEAAKARVGHIQKAEETEDDIETLSDGDLRRALDGILRPDRRD